MDLCAETSPDRRLCACTLQYTLSVASSVRRDAYRMTPLRTREVSGKGCTSFADGIPAVIDVFPGEIAVIADMDEDIALFGVGERP